MCMPQQEQKRRAAWNLAHHKLVRDMAYRVEHREKLRVEAAARYISSPEKVKAAVAASAKAHPETRAEWMALHPEQWAVIRRKHQAKRRTFGFVPLNQPFDGCEAHHLDKQRVIYIPRELHHSVWHSQFSGQGMEQINALALQWLAQNP